MAGTATCGKVPVSGCRANEATVWRIDKAAFGDHPLGRTVLGPEEHLPSMFRTDYVMNANDSYWLGNLKQRLEGFPLIVGNELFIVNDAGIAVYSPPTRRFGNAGFLQPLGRPSLQPRHSQ